MLLVAAIIRISDTESELWRLEQKLEQYKNQKKLSLIGKLKYVLFGNRPKK